MEIKQGRDMEKKELISYLEKDKIRNLNLLNFIKGYSYSSVEKAGESISVKGKSDRNWVFFSSKSDEEFKTLIEKLSSEDENLSGLEDWMLSILYRKYEFEWRLSCERLIYPDNIKLDHPHFETRDLTERDAAYIYEKSRYGKYLRIEYVTDRIKNGLSLGIDIDGCLAAWIMTHDDGSIGFLNVLEEHRRKHIGYDITLSMIKRMRQLKKIPFVHIESDNISSINLSRKAGFDYDRNIHWVKILK